MTAAYQSFILGTSYENTPAFQEYKRLNPNAFIDKEDLQRQIKTLQQRPTSSGRMGIVQMKNRNQRIADLQTQLDTANNTQNPFQGALFDNSKQGNFQGALESMPGYSATLRSGINALQNSAAGRGLQTGTMQKGIMNYGQNLANEFLMQQLGGYQGVQQQGANSMNYGENIGNMIYQPATASASAIANGQTAALGQRQQLYNTAISLGIAALGQRKKLYNMGGNLSYGGGSLGGGSGTFGGRPGVGGGMGSFV
jgi:hypothetical protein